MDEKYITEKALIKNLVDFMRKGLSDGVGLLESGLKVKLTMCPHVIITTAIAVFAAGEIYRVKDMCDMEVDTITHEYITKFKAAVSLNMVNPEERILMGRGAYH